MQTYSLVPLLTCAAVVTAENSRGSPLLVSVGCGVGMGLFSHIFPEYANDCTGLFCGHAAAYSGFPKWQDLSKEDIIKRIALGAICGWGMSKFLSIVPDLEIVNDPPNRLYINVKS